MSSQSSGVIGDYLSGSLEQEENSIMHKKNLGDEIGNCSSSSNLPNDVVVDILCLLPVKSVIRFACACKYWLHVIKSDPQFAVKHYVTRATSSSSVMDSTDCMLHLERSGKFCLYSLTETKTFRILNKFECVPLREMSDGTSCHGIICFYLTPNSYHKIILCNPSIQEVVLLPAPPEWGIYLALGFDPIRNDYKIVSIHAPVTYNSSTCKVGVYSMRCRHWRYLSFTFGAVYHHDGRGLNSLNGNGRWFNLLLYVSDVRRGFLSFDMVDEVFTESSFPECINLKNRRCELLSSTRWQGCLGCFPSWDSRGGSIDIWVLHGCDDDKLWNMALSVRLPQHEGLNTPIFVMNDRELFGCVEKGTEKEIFHYDVDSQQLRPTKRKGYFCCQPHGYVESLVSMKGFMSPSSSSSYCGGEQDGHVEDNNSLHALEQEVAESLCFHEVGRKGARSSSYKFKFG